MVSSTLLKKINQVILLLSLATCFFVFNAGMTYAGNDYSEFTGASTGSGDAEDLGGESTGGGSIQTVALQNPLNSINSIEELLEAILYIFMTLMIPVIVFFIILAGFKYVTAQGNASKVEEANRALLYAVIGGVLVLGAVAIAGIIQSTVSAF